MEKRVKQRVEPIYKDLTVAQCQQYATLHGTFVNTPTIVTDYVFSTSTRPVSPSSERGSDSAHLVVKP